ncbi:CWF19-like protein DRN1 [Candida viswanathii]|uniref:CWF19-like protein DRN1 n=1 Tax=Candida viswanathii TaxID=5486 RepID=A0A367Y653_9ASCO|nr:CWF19-like protein DRN1 [Candida viswanathii]
MSAKFLVLNPSPDALDKVLEKANVQYTKNGPFESTILLGDVLPKGTSLPSTKVLGSTYFTEGKNGMSDEIKEDESNLVDVVPNVTFARPPLRVIKTVGGFTIMIVSKLVEFELPKIDIDILVTYEWPQSIAKLLTTFGSEKVDELVSKIKPRYHFAVGNEAGKFFELEPFAWTTGQVTRFISLGQEGSGDKWFYAFNLSNVDDIPTKLIDNPITSRKREREVENKEEKPRNEAKKAKVVSPDQCFFCVGNANTETHMIVSIGSSSYMTIAKGPLTRSNKNLLFFGHGILIPIEHTATVPQDSSVREELLKYQDTLVAAFDEQKPDLKLIFWEISRDSNIHHHIQFLPVQDTLLNKFPNSLNLRAKLNNDKFKKNQKLHFDKFADKEDPALKKILETNNYMMFTVCNSKTERFYYVAPLNANPIDIQFPRRVLAHVLNLPDRVHWDKCQQPKLKEMADCDNFKSFYQKYDFTV